MGTTNQTNRSLLNKTVDSFYAKFYRLNENVINILGRQIKSIERPAMNFNVIERYNKGIKTYETGRIEFQPISISFSDDDKSLANNAIYTQLYKQAMKSYLGEDDTFDIEVNCYAGDDSIVENFTLKKCIIITVSHSENIYDASTDNLINITVQCETVDFNFI